MADSSNNDVRTIRDPYYKEEAAPSNARSEVQTKLNGWERVAAAFWGIGWLAAFYSVGNFFSVVGKFDSLHAYGAGAVALVGFIVAVLAGHFGKTGRLGDQ